MSGVSGANTDIYARARLRYPIAPTGTNTLVNAALPSGFISLTDGLSFTFINANANTGAVTLDIGDGVARAVVRGDNVALVAGDMPAASLFEVVYNLANNNFRINDGVNQLGGGQTWNDVTASRAIGTTYYNTTGRTIFVCFSGAGSAAAAWPQGNVNGAAVGGGSGSQGIGGNVITAFPVPSGASYSVSNGYGTISINKWSELR